MDELELKNVGELVKIPAANGNHPRTEEEKKQIIINAAKAYEQYLDALGFDWRSDPNSANTPLRVAKAFVNDIAKGCYEDPPAVTAFPNDAGYDGMVCETNIPVQSLCSHHHQNVTGVAHIAYLPAIDGKVIGLSKLNRIVEHYSRRPQIQENFTMQVHAAVNQACSGNRGIAVVVKATHNCVACRGVKHIGASMLTSKLTGEFLDDQATRDEFYRFIDITA